MNSSGATTAGDHHGADDDDEEMEMRRKLVEFEQTLAMFPAEAKAEYVQATQQLSSSQSASSGSSVHHEQQRKVPQHILKESDLMAFLRFENYNALKSAFSFVRYWKTRKEVFGGERFCRPMSLNRAPGASVLERPELDMFAAGCFAVLPRAADGAGRSPVVYFDLTIAGRRTSPPFSAETARRCLFFLCHVAAFSPEAGDAQGHGLVFIIVVSKQLLQQIDEVFKQPLEVAKRALPFRVKQLYFIDGGSIGSKGGGASNLADRLRDASSEDAVVPVVFKESENEYPCVAKMLESLYGFSSGYLPSTLGGSWNWNQLSKWLAGMGYESEGGKPLAIPFAYQRIHSAEQPPPANKSPSTKPSSFPLPCDIAPPEVLDSIPPADIIDYLEAKKRVPVLVDYETPYRRFLACENGDAFAAVRRLASYWRERRECFGDRAFLPLNMSGQGALTMADTRSLINGVMFALPNDRTGRAVLCLDMTSLDTQQQCLLFSARRIWFYLLQIASENSKAQSEGVVCLYIVSNAQQLALGEVGRCMSNLPVNLNKAHVLLLDDPSSWTSNYSSTMPPELPFLGHVQADRIVLHSTSSGHNNLTRLYASGFEKDGLPAKIGGTWDHHGADLKLWIQHRSNFEREELRRLLNNHAEEVYGTREPERTEDLDDDSDQGRRDVSEQGNDVNDEDRLPWICNGLHGFVETNEIMHKGLLDVEEAISMLPFDEKADLLEARGKIPHLVHKEAPPIRYLRFENYNTWAAAQRLATYWTVRKQVFGDRWLLPMDLSGEGTLTRDEVVLFSSNYLVILPYDKKGRSVVCYDPSRRSDHDVAMRSRVGFYLWSVIAENPISQSEGAKCLIVQRTTKIDADAQRAMRVVFEALPIRYQGVHIMNCPYDSEKKTFLQSLVPIMLRFLGVVAKRCTIHVASTKEELIEKLSKFDLSPEGIPECLGGSWSYDMFSHWIELRTRYEWDLPWSGEKMRFLPHVPNYKTKPRSQLTHAEAVERKRRLNVMNSRRKRERVRVEVGVFSEQVAKLRRQNLLLQMEGKRLERYLENARAEVARIEVARSMGRARGSEASLPVNFGLSSHPSGIGVSQTHPSMSMPIQMPAVPPTLQGMVQYQAWGGTMNNRTTGSSLPHSEIGPRSLPGIDQLPNSNQRILGQAAAGRQVLATDFDPGLSFSLPPVVNTQQQTKVNASRGLKRPAASQDKGRREPA